VVVLDTHALLWWALDPDRLSPAATTCLRDMDRDGGFASAISIWELGIKIQRGKLDLGSRSRSSLAASRTLPSSSCSFEDRRAYRSALFIAS
jgi:PIN domain nuclease of toxin-antitoxin system